MMSRKPSVVIIPVRPPSCSSSAFVATVVPCSTSPMSDGSIPAISQISRVPCTVPRAGSSVVDGSLWMMSPCSRPPSAMSVFVPPMSTPRLITRPSYTREWAYV